MPELMCFSSEKTPKRVLPPTKPPNKAINILKNDSHIVEL